MRGGGCRWWVGKQTNHGAGKSWFLKPCHHRRYELHHGDSDQVKAYKALKMEQRIVHYHHRVMAEREMFGWQVTTRCCGLLTSHFNRLPDHGGFFSSQLPYLPPGRNLDVCANEWTNWFPHVFALPHADELDIPPFRLMNSLPTPRRRKPSVFAPIARCLAIIETVGGGADQQLRHAGASFNSPPQQDWSTPEQGGWASARPSSSPLQASARGTRPQLEMDIGRPFAPGPHQGNTMPRRAAFPGVITAESYDSFTGCSSGYCEDLGVVGGYRTTKLSDARANRAASSGHGGHRRAEPAADSAQHPGGDEASPLPVGDEASPLPVISSASVMAAHHSDEDRPARRSFGMRAGIEMSTVVRRFPIPGLDVATVAQTQAPSAPDMPAWPGEDVYEYVQIAGRLAPSSAGASSGKGAGKRHMDPLQASHQTEALVLRSKKPTPASVVSSIPHLPFDSKGTWRLPALNTPQVARARAINTPLGRFSGSSSPGPSPPSGNSSDSDGIVPSATPINRFANSLSHTWASLDPDVPVRAPSTELRSVPLSASVEIPLQARFANVRAGELGASPWSPRMEASPLPRLRRGPPDV